MMRWMMMMNIDFTKYDAHYFDMFMMCKISDYMMFMKYYWLHFNYVDVMHKDLGFMRDIYSGFGDHEKFLHTFGTKYGLEHKFYPEHFTYGDKIVGDKFFHYEPKYGYQHKYIPEHFPVKDLIHF